MLKTLICIAISSLSLLWLELRFPPHSYIYINIASTLIINAACLIYMRLTPYQHKLTFLTLIGRPDYSMIIFYAITLGVVLKSSSSIHEVAARILAMIIVLNCLFTVHGS